MTDFEERVTEALAEGAARAPEGSGLADRARRRALVRRRRTLIGGAVAGVAVVLVPVAVVTSIDDSPRQNQPAGERSEDASRQWRSVEVDDVRVEVPSAWTHPASCSGPGMPPDISAPDHACATGPGLFVHENLLFDAAAPPGLRRCEDVRWCGWVHVGDDSKTAGAVVFVRGVDRETGERILGSAEPVP